MLIAGRVYNWVFSEEVEKKYGELSKKIYSIEIFDKRILFNMSFFV